MKNLRTHPFGFAIFLVVSAVSPASFATLEEEQDPHGSYGPTDSANSNANKLKFDLNNSSLPGHAGHSLKPENPESFANINKADAKNTQGEIFRRFSASFATFYACQPKDTDWYLKRVFEQLKNSVLRSSKFGQLDFTSDQIVEMLKANMNMSKFPSDQKTEMYLQKVGDFAVDLSKKIMNARVKPESSALNDKFWNRSLGRGVLQGIDRVSGDASGTSLTERWKGPLFKIESLNRPASLCKADKKQLATLKDHSNHIRKDRSDFGAIAPAAGVPLRIEQQSLDIAPPSAPSDDKPMELMPKVSLSLTPEVGAVDPAR